MTVPADTGRELTFQTRFGVVKLHEDRLIDFPQGLFGFHECTNFGLTRLPNAENSPLLLLQCVNRPEVAFLVADPALLGLDIKPADRTEALAETHLPEADTQFLTILTLYDHGEGYSLTANLRAPLLIDSAGRIGMQHILTNTAYTTQHKI